MKKRKKSEVKSKCNSEPIEPRIDDKYKEAKKHIEENLAVYYWNYSTLGVK